MSIYCWYYWEGKQEWGTRNEKWVGRNERWGTRNEWEVRGSLFNKRRKVLPGRGYGYLILPEEKDVLCYLFDGKKSNLRAFIPEKESVNWKDPTATKGKTTRKKGRHWGFHTEQNRIFSFKKTEKRSETEATENGFERKKRATVLNFPKEINWKMQRFCFENTPFWKEQKSKKKGQTTWKNIHFNGNNERQQPRITPTGHGNSGAHEGKDVQIAGKQKSRFVRTKEEKTVLFHVKHSTSNRPKEINKNSN